MKLVQPLSATKQRAVEVPVLASGRALLNFGAAPGSSEARVQVTGQAGIVATSAVVARRLIAASSDHSADEHMIEDLEVEAGFVVPGVGFSIVGRPRAAARLYGLFHVAWQWS